MADKGIGSQYRIIKSTAPNINVVEHIPTGKIYVMKNNFCKNDMTKVRKAQLEAEMMQTCSHRYIVKVVNCFVDEDK